MKKRGTLVFSGMIAADPHQGGATWAVLQYLLGFERLGFDVLFIEPIPAAKLSPAGCSLAESHNAAYFNSVVRSFGLAGRSSLLLQGTQQTVGLSYGVLCARAASAQLLVNISGMLTDPSLSAAPPLRIYLDLDPAFVQIWHSQGIDMRLEGHTHFVTVGQAVGEPGCFVPTIGRKWLHTLPPVVMDRWPVCRGTPEFGLTTVGNWRAYGSVNYDNHVLGQKVHSIRPLIDLPAKLGESITLAIAIDPSEKEDLAALERGGWRLTDPRIAAGTPEAYQHFIAASKGEIGIAKHGYTESACGWFSDRSACYLASGRPVVAQETGWSKYLPAGAGLFEFHDTEDAVRAVHEINQHPSRHGAAARKIAQAFFDSDRVLTAMLGAVGISGGVSA